MMAVCGTGNGSMRETGNGLGDGTEIECWAESAEDTSATEAEDRADVEDAAGRRHHLRRSRSPAWAALARGEGGRTAGGSAEQEEWRGGEEEGGRRGEGRSGSGQSCGC